MHRDRRALLARFRQWLRYRRYYRALLAEARPRLRDEARKAARHVEDSGHE